MQVRDVTGEYGLIPAISAYKCVCCSKSISQLCCWGCQVVCTSTPIGSLSECPQNGSHSGLAQRLILPNSNPVTVRCLSVSRWFSQFLSFTLWSGCSSWRQRDHEATRWQSGCRVLLPTAWRLRQIRRRVGPQVTTQLVLALATSRLDYCNSVLASLPQSKVEPLQRVQNAAARIIFTARAMLARS